MASLFSSMFNGLSGLRANSADLAVIGDNIANAGTIGFKGSRTAFEDALGETLIGGGGGQIGLGVNVQAVQRILTQGSLANTGVTTDLAIEGNGFFIVDTGENGRGFTRNGQFTVDNQGRLVTLDGHPVQGFQADANGTINAGLGDITVNNVASPPKATTQVSIQANLDATAANADPAIPFNAQDPTATSTFQSSVTIFDSLGNPVQADVYFRKNATGSWEWHALTDGANTAGGTAGTNVEIAAGTMTFDTDGKLVTAVQDPAINFDPVGGTPNQFINFNVGDPTSTGGTGLSGTTQFASASAMSFVSQDGAAPGKLANVNISEDGTIIGVFSNGVSQALGQVALATFTAPDQLARQGGNLYTESSSSGQPIIGIAGTGGRGAIIGGALEQSNVDVGDELVRMIIAQRNFQSNSKIVSTADTLLGELLNLKR